MFKMFNVALFLLLFGQTLAADYCKLTCKIKDEIVENSACKCKTGNCHLMEETNSQEFRDMIVDVHNEFRSKVATKDHTFEPPKASNMRTLNYDLDLEHTSKCNENIVDCKLKHDRCGRTETFQNVGQNLAFYSTTAKMDWRKDVKRSITNWYNEITRMKKGDLKYSSKAGHFTQLAWAKTTHVGCSMFTGDKGNAKVFFLACNYGPSGNFPSQDMYKTGEPCSDCGGLQCNGKYKGLCGDLQNAPSGTTGAYSPKDHKDIQTVENTRPNLHHTRSKSLSTDDSASHADFPDYHYERMDESKKKTNSATTNSASLILVHVLFRIVMYFY